MIVKIEIDNKTYTVDLSKGMDLSLPIDDKANGPNCFYAERPVFKPYQSGSFIASVKQGGAVNSYNVSFNPHGNGTHTECQGHITETWEKIHDIARQSHFVAELITIEPEPKGTDRVITRAVLEERVNSSPRKALIIRTSPNDSDKKERDYSGKNPPFLSVEALTYLVNIGIDHLLVDLPSVDKEDDGGALAGHKAFWQLPQPGNRQQATITEMIYVDDTIEDGIYLLNLQLASFQLDCTPSRPVLYKIF